MFGGRPDGGTPTVIDTLRFANKLKEAGMEPRLAEAITRVVNAEFTALEERQSRRRGGGTQTQPNRDTRPTISDPTSR